MHDATIEGELRNSQYLLPPLTVMSREAYHRAAAGGCHRVLVHVRAVSGGGTRFWREGVALDALPPPAVDALIAPQGAAVLFHGDVTHAGNKVHSGVRHLLVQSFTLHESEVENGMARAPSRWFVD